MKERAFAAEGYRYGFNGQEQDGELMDGAVVFKYRVHDPRIGRFLSVDPLTSTYPWNSSYAFAENRVIDGIELEGLEVVTLSSISFAPFEKFGGGFIGDGKDRKFGDDIIRKKGEENFRIGAHIEIDIANEEKKGQSLETTTSTHGPTGETAQSETNFNGDVLFSNNELWFQMQGNDDALFFGVNPGYIDVKVAVQFKMKSRSVYQVTGQVYGDRFPANETYLVDAAGNKLFLGVSAVEINNEAAPFWQLLGVAFSGMSKFDFYIHFDEDDNFKSVLLKDGTEYTIEEWNSKFEKLSPSTPTTNGTNVTEGEVQTDYDPGIIFREVIKKYNDGKFARKKK